MLAEEFSLLPSRRGDAIIKVAEDREAHRLNICGTNHAFDKLAHVLDTDALMGQPLDLILNDTARQVLGEAEDMADALRRMRELKLLLGDEETQGLQVKIVQAPPENGRYAYFVVLRDAEAEITQRSQYRQLLQANLKGHEDIDQESTLPNAQAFLKDFELVQHQVRSKQMRACLAVLQIDPYEAALQAYGDAIRPVISRHVASIHRMHMREYDSMARLDANLYGLLLLDAGAEEARIALNRLRSTIQARPVEAEGEVQLALTISVGFMEMPATARAESLIKRCAKAMEHAAAEGGNLLKIV